MEEYYDQSGRLYKKVVPTTIGKDVYFFWDGYKVCFSFQGNTIVGIKIPYAGLGLKRHDFQVVTMGDEIWVDSRDPWNPVILRITFYDDSVKVRLKYVSERGLEDRYLLYPRKLGDWKTDVMSFGENF